MKLFVAKGNLVKCSYLILNNVNVSMVSALTELTVVFMPMTSSCYAGSV